MSLLVRTRPGVALASGVALGVALTIGAPAVGTQLQRAFDAQNAHQVDGKHAVGAGASIDQRKGRLVSTNSKGRLPNNIIKKAPNAGKLEGVRADDYRFLTLETGAAIVQGGATFVGPIRLPDAGTPSFGWSWTLPPDYRPKRPVTLVLYVDPFAAGGSVMFDRQTSSFARPGDGVNGDAADPVYLTDNPLPTPVSRRVEVMEVRIVPPAGVAAFRPGDGLSVALRRLADSDTNTDAVWIRQAFVRY